MIKIIADNKIPFLEGVLEPFADIEYHPGKNISRDIIKDADALIIRTRTKCNKELLDGTNVKFIATATIGFNHIDTDYCEQAGITWTNAPGCNSSSVQQYITSALGFLAKKHNFSLQDRTLGIVGVGHVGKKVLRMAEYLGMRIVLNDPPRVRDEGLCGFISLDGILREADIITFHVPLNMTGEDKTYHLADEAFFQKVNAGSFIINSSRGEVVDTIALKSALRSRNVKGCVIDVWENEPDIDTELLSLVDIATPHVAGYSLDGKANGTAMSVNALCEFFDLPFKDWYPFEIASVKDNMITINCKKKSIETIILEAAEQTYDIKSDSKVLKKHPSFFEQYRGEYPLRREYLAYKVKLINGNNEIENALKKLGFIVCD